ncbi:DUF421 domain-containing protein [Halalkalibacillus halophilus]|uniref:DUF421 domain-containing protein n=1 Tax=Halalkalibacillus halophilus TaxID=392827 RepID=UPI0003F4D945|nr:DUF421 domain-containing protein [Halalkalibacillus halophilus]
MNQTLWDLLVVFGRIITILPLLLIVIIYMGKRAVGQLPIFDFLIIITLGSIVGADIADPGVNHLPTAFAVVLIGVIQKIVSKLKLQNRRFGKLLTFEPTVIIQDGKLLPENLKKESYSIDSILQMLREKDVFDVSEVETATIEANGALSVLKKPAHLGVTIEDLNLSKSSNLQFPVIMEGEVYENVLQQFGLSSRWVYQELEKKGIKKVDEVFFASINNQLELFVSPANVKTNVPFIRH